MRTRPSPRASPTMKGRTTRPKPRRVSRPVSADEDSLPALGRLRRDVTLRVLKRPNRVNPPHRRGGTFILFVPPRTLPCLLVPGCYLQCVQFAQGGTGEPVIGIASRLAA